MSTRTKPLTQRQIDSPSRSFKNRAKTMGCEIGQNDSPFYLAAASRGPRPNTWWKTNRVSSKILEKTKETKWT